MSIVLDRDDYEGLDNSALIGLDLTEYELAIIASLFVLSTERQNWLPMTDAQWDSLSSTLAEIMSVLYE